MIELIKERFFWPKMYNDVKYLVNIIGKCIKEKTPNTLPQAPDHHIFLTHGTYWN